MPAKVAILGSGNIGTDLMVKVMRMSRSLEMGALAGVDPGSEGLARGRSMGVPVTDKGIQGLLAMKDFDEIRVVFDATSAKAHLHTVEALRGRGKKIIDLTPAAIGPYVVPVVNLDEHANAPILNMVSCGGQATIPVVAAVNRVSPVHYAEIVSSIASRSAGPGTRANIDEFTHTTACAIERIGGALKGKAIIVLNPAEPPLIMRNTVFCLTNETDRDAVVTSVERMVAAVRTYVPGYRLKQEIQFDNVARGMKTSIYLEIEGAGHYLPSYAGNLDIMTSAALKTAERLMEINQEANGNGQR